MPVSSHPAPQITATAKTNPPSPPAAEKFQSHPTSPASSKPPTSPPKPQTKQPPSNKNPPPPPPPPPAPPFFPPPPPLRRPPRLFSRPALAGPDRRISRCPAPADQSQTFQNSHSLFLTVSIVIVKPETQIHPSPRQNPAIHLNLPPWCRSKRFLVGGRQWLFVLRLVPIQKLPQVFRGRAKRADRIGSPARLFYLHPPFSQHLAHQCRPLSAS